MSQNNAVYVTWKEVALMVGAPEDHPAGPQFVELAKMLVDPSLPFYALAAGIKLLAAHLWTVLEPKISSESAGGVSVHYAMPALGEGLEASVWGMQYKALLDRYSPTTPIVL